MVQNLFLHYEVANFAMVNFGIMIHGIMSFEITNFEIPKIARINDETKIKYTLKKFFTTYQ